MLVLAAFLLIALPAFAQESPRDWSAAALGAYEEANTLLREDPLAAREKYLEAAALFERILEEGRVRNGSLYFNLGNVYYLADDLGRAILNYRRAGHFLPGDLQLRQNLAAARRQRRDNISSTAEAPLFKTLLFWHYDFSLPTRAGLFILAYLLIWAFATGFLFRPRIELRWAATACAACALLFAASVLLETLLASRTREGVVLAPQVTARKSDSALQDPAFAVPLHAGTEFSLVQTRGDWRQIELTDGRGGWLPAAAIEMLEVP